MIDMNRLLTQVMGGDAAPQDERQAVRGRLAPHLAAHAALARTGEKRWPSAAQLQERANGLLGSAGTLGAGALAGGLTGLLFSNKRMREVAGTAMQVGAATAIGAIAFKAYQNYRQGRPVLPQSISDFLTGAVPSAASAPAGEIAAWIPSPDRSADVEKLLLRAMVAAAASDGHLDKTEYSRIREHLRVAGLSEEEQFFLGQLMLRPCSIDELAAAASTPELRTEVYVAARLAIEPDSSAESEWLENLAAALDIQRALKAHLDAIGGDAQAQAA
jgi:uncharacterized membrane protein YebE (DUF533 family)